MIVLETHKTIIERDMRNGAAGKELKGRFSEVLCERECRALSVLQGMDGVQQLIERDSPRSFTYTWIEGTSIKKAPSLIPDYFSRLQRLMESIHSRGVVDVDMCNSCDWLVGRDGNPYIIDFGGAIVRSELLGKLFFRVIRARNMNDFSIRVQRYSHKLS